jgi:hypothetical protein
MDNKIGYVINIDVGILEKEAILLMESIIKFVESAPFLIVIKPNLKPLSDSTMKYFLSKNVHFHELEMENFFPCNIIMSKIFIASYAEELYGETLDYILLLDNDTMFLNKFDSDLFHMNFSIAARLTDFSDRSLLSFDNCSSIWRYLIDRFDIRDNPKWKYKCIRDNVIAYASFNSGFVLETTKTHLFHKWKDIADYLKNDEKFIDLLNKDMESVHYLDQILLSLTLMKDFYPENVKILNIKYNFNLESIFFGRTILFHGQKWIFKKLPIPIDSLVHIHYHQTFKRRGSLHYFNDDEHVNLLKSFVPFDNNLNSDKNICRNILSKVYTFLKFIQYHILNTWNQEAD